MPRPCAVCDHPERDSIDAAIVAGQSIRGIARRYGVSKDSVSRHAQNHLPETLRKAHAVKELTRADDLLGRVETLITEAEGLIEHGKGETVNVRAWSSGISELRKCLELLARVTGELDERPQITLSMLPEWVEIRTLILAAVDDHPDIQEKIINAIGAPED